MTLFLKFTDEDEARNALSDYISEGEWVTDSHTHSLSVIGMIYKPTGNIIHLGGEHSYPEMAPIPGYHVNFIGALPESLTQYLVTPANPTRVFAT
jgi:hypothetical protein